MDEYMQNMKALRFQMNDVEDDAAKISVEEQTLNTSITAMEIDIESGNSKITSLKEETELMLKKKSQICEQILDKHKKVASLEAKSSELSQTLELIQQERVSLALKLKEKRDYYNKVLEDLHAKLQGQRDWINSRKEVGEVGSIGSVQVQGRNDNRKDTIEGNSTGEIHSITGSSEYETNASYKALMTQLESARAKLAELRDTNAKLVADRSEMAQSIKQLQCRINDFPPELRAMNMNALEEEHKALLSDKAGEIDYQQTMQCQIEQLKGISHVIKCACGEEYKVEMVNC